MLASDHPPRSGQDFGPGTDLACTALLLALSRTREFNADLAAARLTGDPHGLASALDMVDRGNRSVWSWVFGARREPANPLLQTHPPVEEWIRRLLALERGGQQGDDGSARRSRTSVPIGGPRFVGVGRSG